MKTGGVAIVFIMILALAQANDNLSFSQIEPNNAWGKVKCGAKCALECAPLIESEILYPLCVAKCLFKCRNAAFDIAYDCVKGCDLTKSIQSNNNDAHARGVTPFVLNSCLQTCQTKN
ncbi:hypothetical protein VNO77_24995 [Canavalia gladiata]|uniref:Uncharacterized protein n=1 Tax=Canavalia gladiata TaxID=3824 RepID=A0AAN9L7C0_CANGL